MNTDTTFEYMLQNINEKDIIINEIYLHIQSIDWSDLINKSNIQNYISRIDNEYEHYLDVIDRFKIEVTQFISDYYSVDDEYKDMFNNKIIYTYSSNKNHYNPLITDSAKSKFDIKELIDIFTEHCYDFKKFHMYNNILTLNKTRLIEKAIYNRLNNYILSEGIYESINSIINEFKLLIKWMNGYIPQDTIIEINKLLNKFSSINLEMRTVEVVFDVCECKNKMEIHPISSELICEKCGYSYMLEGTVLEDTMFYSQTDTRYKHANYQPSKHCKCWLERIQAKENNVIPKEYIERIENCIKRDNITNKKSIPISQFRRYLKSCNLSELNEHIALIRKMITGISPPSLTYAESQTIINSFSKSVKAYNIIKPNTKLNILYYPFVIRKLIEMHVDDFNKKRELLAFIHLQGSNTLTQNDKLWKQICNTVPEFKFKPTDRYEFID